MLLKMTPIARPLSDTLYLIKSIIKIMLISYSTLSVPSYAPHLPPIVQHIAQNVNSFLNYLCQSSGSTSVMSERAYLMTSVLLRADLCQSVCATSVARCLCYLRGEGLNPVQHNRGRTEHLTEVGLMLIGGFPSKKSPKKVVATSVIFLSKTY